MDSAFDTQKRAGEDLEARPTQRKKTIVEDEEGILLWRRNPKDSFSDWVIEIQSNKQDDSSHVATYHVHRLILGHGARRSEYFAKLFGESTTSSQNKIDLDPVVAAAFPCFLDYIYGGPLAATTETATALHHLGKYFGVSKLSEDAEQFCKDDISLTNASIYCKHVIQLKSTGIRGVLVEFVAKNITKIDPSSFIAKAADTKFWGDILQKLDPTQQDTYAHVSKLIATHCAGTSSLDPVAFRKLTGLATLPQVDPSVALTLCQVEDRLKIQATEPEAVSLLQGRCATALAKTWKALQNPDHNIRRQLVDRKPAFLVDLLGKALTQVNNELQACQHQNRRLVDHAKTAGGTTSQDEINPQTSRPSIASRPAKPNAVPASPTGTSPQQITRTADGTSQDDINPQTSRSTIALCPITPNVVPASPTGASLQQITSNTDWFEGHPGGHPGFLAGSLSNNQEREHNASGTSGSSSVLFSASNVPLQSTLFLETFGEPDNDNAASSSTEIQDSNPVIPQSQGQGTAASHDLASPAPLNETQAVATTAAAATASRAPNATTAPGGSSNAGASEREKEMRRQKERFPMFTRVLMKYLETKDPPLQQKVKAIIKDCFERNKRQEPGYESVTGSMRERLKHVVAHAYWKRSESYLEHYLAQKENAAGGKSKVKSQKHAAELKRKKELQRRRAAAVVEQQRKVKRQRQAGQQQALQQQHAAQQAAAAATVPPPQAAPRKRIKKAAFSRDRNARHR